MVLGWFFRDEFQELFLRINRLKKYISIIDKEFNIDHYEELYRHFVNIKKSLPKLLEVFKKEKETIDKMPENEYKEIITDYANKLQKSIEDLHNWLDNAIDNTENIRKIRQGAQLSNEKNRLKKIIIHLDKLLDNSQREAFDMAKLSKSWKKSNAKSSEKIPKVNVVGALNNGWKLSNIQKVINQLGGRVIYNSSEHPYKICFPKKRTIPLAVSTPPFMLVKEVHESTNVENRVLVVSFSKGHLVAA